MTPFFNDHKFYNSVLKRRPDLDDPTIAELFDSIYCVKTEGYWLASMDQHRS